MVNLVVDRMMKFVVQYFIVQSIVVQPIALANGG